MAAKSWLFLFYVFSSGREITPANNTWSNPEG